jgi:hypothetical protein
MSPIPERSPFLAGDRVRLHGYPGAPYRHQRDGFVGTVERYGGRSHLLGGTTDTGEPWCESWGLLVPDDAPNPFATVLCCTCCPCAHHHPNFWGPGVPRLPGITAHAPPTEPKPSHVDRKQAA